MAGTKRHLQRMGRRFRLLDHRSRLSDLDDHHGFSGKCEDEEGRLQLILPPFSFSSLYIAHMLSFLSGFGFLVLIAHIPPMLVLFLHRKIRRKTFTPVGGKGYMIHE